MTETSVIIKNDSDDIAQGTSRNPVETRTKHSLVLVCIPCLLVGGTEVQTLNLVRALVDGGHRVVVACYFEHCRQMVEAYQHAGAKVELLSPEGVRIRGWRSVTFLYKGLRRLVRQYHSQVAHVQYMAPGAIPIFVLKLLGVKTIVATAHTAADIYPSLRLVHFIQQHCVKAWTCITCKAEESFFGSSQLYHDGLALKKHNHFTIYNALPAYIRISEQGKYIKDVVTIGVVSRLETIKGMDLVVPAFAKVAAEYSNVRLLVVGDGTLRDNMQQQVQELGVGHLAEFADRQGQDTLQGYYDKIDILLMPSRSEGFGLTAIEGMARGCVVVASDVGGLPEVVRDGEVGLLHRSEDIDDMAEKTRSIVKSSEMLDKMSECALSYVKHFTFESYSKQFNSLYNKM